ncbi:MAG: hypothetical protein K6V97_09085 [Actinomycetia bacterium]|nr:hypothetical protein [Actinomycetes bacterium]
MTAVTLTVSGPVRPGATVTLTAAAVDPGGQPEYQFWVETQTGWRAVQGYSPTPTYTLSLEAGSAVVVVYALDRAAVAAGAWSQARAAETVLDVGSTVSVTASASSVPLGEAVTVKAAATGLIRPVYQFWVRDPEGRWTGTAFSASPTLPVTPTGTSGIWEVVVYAKDAEAPDVPADLVDATTTFQAYGPAAALAFVSAAPYVPADGTFTKTFTATVVDADGTPVADLNGALTLTYANPEGDRSQGAVSVWNGSAFVTAGPVTIPVRDGVAQVTVRAGSTPGVTDVLDLAGTVGQGRLTVLAAAPDPTAQVGYRFFTPQGVPLGAQNPLVLADTGAIELLLKPVNAWGEPVAATFADDALLSTPSPVCLVSCGSGSSGGSFATSPNTLSVGPNLSVYVPAGTTAVPVWYTPPLADTFVPLAAPAGPAYALVTTFTDPATGQTLPAAPAAGAPPGVFIPAGLAPRFETVTGVEPGTTYTVTAQLYDLFGHALTGLPADLLPLARGPVDDTVAVGIASPWGRSPASQVTGARLGDGGTLQFTYTAGASLGRPDVLELTLDWSRQTGPTTEGILTLVSTNAF